MHSGGVDYRFHPSSIFQVDESKQVTIYTYNVFNIFRRSKTYNVCFY